MNRFSECKTLTDIYTIARQLRGEGVPDVEVNSLITKAKKELMSKSTGIKRLSKIPVSVEGFPTVPTTQYVLRIDSISNPIIRIENDGTVVL